MPEAQFDCVALSEIIVCIGTYYMEDITQAASLYQQMPTEDYKYIHWLDRVASKELWR